MIDKINDRKWLIGLAIILILAGIGVWKDVARPEQPKSQGIEEEISGSKVIQFQGENGKTVLELLAKDHQVQTVKSDFGTFINSIDSLENSDNSFWFYYVNGKMGEVAADKYQTKDVDQIEWRYETLK